MAFNYIYCMIVFVFILELNAAMMKNIKEFLLFYARKKISLNWINFIFIFYLIYDSKHE